MTDQTGPATIIELLNANAARSVVVHDILERAKGSGKISPADIAKILPRELLNSPGGLQAVIRGIGEYLKQEKVEIKNFIPQAQEQKTPLERASPEAGQVNSPKRRGRPPKERPQFNPLADILAKADEPAEELDTELRPSGRRLVPVEKQTRVLTLKDGSTFVDTLDDEEEKEVELMDLYGSVDSFLRKTAKYRLLTAEEETELGRRVHNDKDLDARNELVLHNVRLVVSIARRYLWSKLTFDDLFQEGLLGLIIGAEKYDHSLGYRFTTYATWWIRQAITRAISDKAEAIRVPVHVQEVMSKIRAYLKKNKLGLDEFPQYGVLARELGVSVEQVRTARHAFQLTTVSLNEPLSNEEGSATIEDTLVYEVSPESLMNRLEEEQRMEQVIDQEIKLKTDVITSVVRNVEGVYGSSSRNCEIFKLMCGINSDWKPCTLEEAGQKYGVTRERVRQILKKTLEDLKVRGIELSYDDLRDCCSKIGELQKLKEA